MQFSLPRKATCAIEPAPMSALGLSRMWLWINTEAGPPPARPKRGLSGPGGDGWSYAKSSGRSRDNYSPIANAIAETAMCKPNSFEIHSLVKKSSKMQINRR
jgi:hypothetical protein